jgi:hypothetical protein
MLINVLVCIAIVLLTIIISFYIVYKNKFRLINIKIKNAEENINQILNDKHQNLIKIHDLIKEKKEDNTAFDEINDIKCDELDSFELNNKLSKFDKDVFEIIDYEKNIIFDDEEQKIFEDYANINVSCLASMKYYNDNVIIYNKLITSKPANIIAKLRHYKKKELYTNEKEEVFEILKN